MRQNAALRNPFLRHFYFGRKSRQQEVRELQWGCMHRTSALLAELLGRLFRQWCSEPAVSRYRNFRVFTKARNRQASAHSICSPSVQAKPRR
jgi:hypothetical protein